MTSEAATQTSSPEASESPERDNNQHQGIIGNSHFPSRDNTGQLSDQLAAAREEAVNLQAVLEATREVSAASRQFLEIMRQDLDCMIEVAKASVALLHQNSDLMAAMRSMQAASRPPRRKKKNRVSLNVMPV